MTETTRQLLLLALTLFASMAGKHILQRLRLPPAVGFLAIGILLRLFDANWRWLTDRSADVLPLMLWATGWFLLKVSGFAAVCYLFSHFVEERLTNAFRQTNPPTGPLLLIIAASLIIGGIAEFAGLSIAVGAFLAGLMFSRDREHVQIEGSFANLYAFFTPFFFIGIGLDIELSALSSALGVGFLLTAAAIVGKLLGNGLPALTLDGLPLAALLGCSMIPRAEIAMVIVQRGAQLGDWAVPPEIYAGMVFVSLATCMVSPLAVYSLLGKWPQTKAVNESHDGE